MPQSWTMPDWNGSRLLKTRYSSMRFQCFPQCPVKWHYKISLTSSSETWLHQVAYLLTAHISFPWSTLTALRQQYWVPSGRQYIKGLLRHCTTCKRHHGRPYPVPETAPLPKDRLRDVAPFTSTGVDFTGALYVQSDHGESKVYIFFYLPALPPGQFTWKLWLTWPSKHSYLPLEGLLAGNPYHRWLCRITLQHISRPRRSSKRCWAQRS